MIRPLRIAILGGTGFVGTRLITRLIKDGHTVTALTRDREQHKHLLVLPGLYLLNTDPYHEGQLAARFRGQDAVINLVGILNERWFDGSGFRRAHVELVQGILRAAKSSGVTRFIDISSLKAAPDAPSHYLKTKGEAEKLIREQAGALEWTILKPAVMFGPGDTFLNRFAQLLASVPVAFPLACPNARLQPVSVDDVVEAIVRCLQSESTNHQTYELGGPQVYTLREVVSLVAQLTGHSRWIVGLPGFAAYIQGVAMNFVPGRPFSTDNYRSLTVDSVVSEDGLAKLGITPHSMAAGAGQFLGSLEDNARLSRDRSAAGRGPVA